MMIRWRRPQRRIMKRQPLRRQQARWVPIRTQHVRRQPQKKWVPLQSNRRPQPTRQPQRTFGNAVDKLRQRQQPAKQQWRQVTERKMVENIPWIEHFTCGIQSELTSHGSRFDYTNPLLEWPRKLTPIFAISLRLHRFIDLQRRMKQWAPLISLMPATDGSKVNYKLWRSKRRLAKNITKGQIGCYESHVRCWQRIVSENLSSALILEDDANIVYSHTTVDRLNEMLYELESLMDWHVMYIGNIGLHPIRETLTKHINRPSGWEGLYTYLITNEGARRLLSSAFPISMAVDIYVGDQAAKGRIKTLALSPPLNFVVPVQSDTDVRI